MNTKIHIWYKCIGGLGLAPACSLIGGSINRGFLNRGMAKTHLKKCSPSLVIEEMQLKMTQRFHFTLVRMAKIQNKHKNRKASVEQGQHLGVQTRTVTSKSMWQFLKKAGIDLPKDLTVPLLSINPKDAPPDQQRLTLLGS